MTKIRRVACLFLLLLMVASILVLVQSISAQSIPKPSVPEFTLHYTIQSRDVPGATPTYTIDPYTGQQKIQTPGSSGYHLDTRTVEIKVKNQPFTPYVDSNYNGLALYYNVSYKGHYETDWHYSYYHNEQSSSDYTVINFTDVPNDGGTMEFRLQAQIGYYSEYYMPFVAYSFRGEVSGWSSTQSVDVPAATLNPQPESQETWILYGAIAGLGAAVAVLTVAVALMYKKINGKELKHNAA
jgi:hypothetical protein